jgi:O-antigen/teichoic acid export membrane protein|tara:strand:- start:123 stop:377 length:255 start_codon:yes stop_codon:yes gene_type:complete
VIASIGFLYYVYGIVRKKQKGNTMQINPMWIMFTLVFGGLGIWLIALDSLAGYLMCFGVLGWLFVANNTGQLFIEDEDEEYEDD